MVFLAPRYSASQVGCHRLASRCMIIHSVHNNLRSLSYTADNCDLPPISTPTGILSWHSASLYMCFLVRAGLCCAPRSDSMFLSVVTATHTHTPSVMGRTKWPATYPDNLHSGCSYHLHSSHCFFPLGMRLC